MPWTALSFHQDGARDVTIGVVLSDRDPAKCLAERLPLETNQVSELRPFKEREWRKEETKNDAREGGGESGQGSGRVRASLTCYLEDWT